MKRYKVTLNEGSAGHKLSLFPSAEALYVWACALERGEQVQVDGMVELPLGPGDFIELEQRGFEYVYDHAADTRGRRFDNVRLGKASRALNSSGFSVTIHQGWVTGGMLPLRQHSDQNLVIEPLADGEGRLDLGALFQDPRGDG